MMHVKVDIIPKDPCKKSLRVIFNFHTIIFTISIREILIYHNCLSEFDKKERSVEIWNFKISNMCW